MLHVTQLIIRQQTFPFSFFLFRFRLKEGICKAEKGNKLFYHKHLECWAEHFDFVFDYIVFLKILNIFPFFSLKYLLN